MSPTKTTPSLGSALDDEWETISVGIGEEHPIEERQLTGNYIGTTVTEMADADSESGKRDQSVHQFAPTDDPSAIVFLWGSYELDSALSKCSQGDRVRVTFTGRSQIKSKDGQPRQVKHYKVQVSKK